MLNIARNSLLLLSAALYVAAQGTGTQFITGPCASDADCASGCCSFLRGVCAGSVIAQERASDGGCGFGNPTPNRNAADIFLGITPGNNAAPPSAAPAVLNNVVAPARAPGTQFITGPCGGDTDCASGCCSFLRGVCAGAIVATERASDGGCGFGNASPNQDAANRLRGQ